ncbi:MAG: Wzz/FepE/Etk N-terminal domain-containing protein [Bacillota bacterium]|nr:Wzz/FepE/Etk N-terminal domain-containing protein [Bacillota bacterium]
MYEKRDEIEIDLREIFHILKRRFLIILLAGLLFAGVAGVYSFFLAEPVYESTSRLYILSQSTSITSLADIQMGSSLALDYMELIKSRPVVKQVKDNLGLDMSNKEILAMMTIENPSDTRIINISIQGHDPNEASQIANEFSRVAKRQISDIMETDEPSVVEVAIPANQPIKPEKTKNIAIGFLLGMFLSALIIIVVHVLNDKLKDQEDVERYLALNTLASIPYEQEKKPKKKSGRKR